MCGRFTVKATWAELVALYRLTMEAPPHNLRPRYNVCPTDPVDVVTAEERNRLHKQAIAKTVQDFVAGIPSHEHLRGRRGDAEVT